jgi:general secretion pathway protein A
VDEPTPSSPRRRPLPPTIRSPFESLLGPEAPLGPSEPSRAAAPSAADEDKRRPLLALFPQSRSAASSGPPIAFSVPANDAGRRPAPGRGVGAPATKASDRYESFYGLSEPPFALSTDPRFFYHSRPHDEVAQHLLSAIRDREGLVVITGDIGTGKTTLCRVVMDQLDRRTLTSLVGEPFGSAEAWLKRILVDFGVMSAEESDRPTPAESLNAALRSFAGSLASLDASAVVFVDDAHGAPPQVFDRIRALCDAGGASNLLQVVLVGQPSLTRRLERPEHRDLKARVAVRAHLTPLPPDEIEAYVVHRLVAGGSNPRLQFSDGALEYLYALSRGVPRVVNLLCDRALVRGYERALSTIDRDVVDMAAEDLDVGLPQPKGARALTMTAAAAGLMVCLAAGGAAAAWVLHDAVQRTMVRWDLTHRR